MKILYMGTGAAEGVPAMFCNCQNCINIRKLGSSEFRSRSQILIDGELSVDFPPEAYVHSLRFGVNYSSLKNILVTHSHMDHFYAHDFILRGYKYASFGCDKLNIYGNAEVLKVFSECTAREMKPEVSPYIQINEVAPFQSFKVGDYRVMAIPAKHSKTEDALIYYIEKGGKGYLHLYDTGAVSEQAIKYLADNGAKANLISFDCTFADSPSSPAARHMGINEDISVRDDLLRYGIADGETKSVITHFSHNSNPTRARLKAIEDKYGVTAAYDGLEVEI